MKQINVKLFHSFKSVLIKSLLVVLLHVQINLVLKLKLCQTNNLLKNHTRQLLKNLKNEIYTQDKIWDANLVNRKLISKYNKGLQVLLCVIDVFSKYAQVFNLKDKKVLQLVMPIKKVQVSLIATQTKYGQTKVASFTIDG